MIEPAMTKEEWANCTSGVERGGVLISLHKMAPYRAVLIESGIASMYGAGDWISQEALHTLAALCLHEQPWGFTREDVINVRESAAFQPDLVFADHLRNLAARIEALLPPEQP